MEGTAGGWSGAWAGRIAAVGPASPGRVEPVGGGVRVRDGRPAAASMVHAARGLGLPQRDEDVARPYAGLVHATSAESPPSSCRRTAAERPCAARVFALGCGWGPRGSGQLSRVRSVSARPGCVRAGPNCRSEAPVRRSGRCAAPRRDIGSGHQAEGTALHGRFTRHAPRPHERCWVTACPNWSLLSRNLHVMQLQISPEPLGISAAALLTFHNAARSSLPSRETAPCAVAES